MNTNSHAAGAFAHIKILRGSCYGSPSSEIYFDFNFDERKVSAVFYEGFKNKLVSLDFSEVEDLFSKISAIVEKPEVLTELRRVEIRYHAEIEWKNFEFIEGKKSGKFKAFSNEWFTDEIEEFIKYEAATPEIAERFQKILDINPHRRALEIYRVVKCFFRKYLI